MNILTNEIEEEYVKCILCEEEYTIKRKELGYDTCLECGEEEAQKQKNKVETRAIPELYKGPYKYITNLDF
jgi:ribosomal protein L37AE/L43A